MQPDHRSFLVGESKSQYLALRRIPPVALVPWTKRRPGNENERYRAMACGNGPPLPLRFFPFLQAANNLSQASPRGRVTSKAAGWRTPVDRRLPGPSWGVHGRAPPCSGPQLHCSAGSPGRAFRSSPRKAGNNLVTACPPHLPSLLPTLPASAPPSVLHPSPGPHSTVPALYEADPGPLYVAISYPAPRSART